MQIYADSQAYDIHPILLHSCWSWTTVTLSTMYFMDTEYVKPISNHTEKQKNA